MYILYVEVFGLKLRWLAVATSFLLTTCAPDTPNTHLLHHISIWNGIFRNLDPDTLQVHIFICAQHFTLPFFHLKKNSLSIKAPVVSLGITQCPTFEGSRSTPCIALFLLFFSQVSVEFCIQVSILPRTQVSQMSKCRKICGVEIANIFFWLEKLGCN